MPNKNRPEAAPDIVDKKQSQTSPKAQPDQRTLPKEINGTKGLEPTRYGDWEHKGRCYDF